MKNFCLLLFALCLLSFAHAQKNYTAIYSGIPWFDNKGNIVSAHGANIIQEQKIYYLFGEYHTDTGNAFAGFSCYSSDDLCNWKFESIALPVQDSGRLSAQTVGERVKVMKCPQTGEFVMYMHTDNLNYKDACVGYATAKNITGPYQFKGALLFNNRPVKKWDMGTFQDKDGSGYIITHGGEIYKLSDDYKTIVEQVSKNFTSGFEAPTLFRKDSIYYFIGSDLTGWEKNDNYYFTATSLSGPWVKRGYIAPKGTLTWNSQSTYVLPVYGTKKITYMFMGDRWSFPKQASAATYIWQPLTINGYTVAIPDYQAAWNINSTTGEAMPLNIIGKSVSANDKQIVYTGNWRQDTLAVKSSDEKGASFTFHAKGTQLGLYGLARPDGGYAFVTVQNSKGKVVTSAAVDMYCKYAVLQLKFLTPVLPQDTYTVSVSVLGEHWWWKEKSGKLWGSLGNIVSIEKLIVNEYSN